MKDHSKLLNDSVRDYRQSLLKAKNKAVLLEILKHHYIIKKQARKTYRTNND